MKAFYAELSKRETIVDPTLTVWEPLMTSDGTAISPEYAPFVDVVAASVARVVQDRGLLAVRRAHPRRLPQELRQDGRAGRATAQGGRADGRWDRRLRARAGPRAGTLPAGRPDARESLQTRHDHSGSDDRHGRPRRIDRAPARTADIILVDGDVRRTSATCGTSRRCSTTATGSMPTPFARRPASPACPSSAYRRFSSSRISVSSSTSLGPAAASGPLRIALLPP